LREMQFFGRTRQAAQTGGSLENQKLRGSAVPEVPAQSGSGHCGSLVES